jgi:4-hydroxy-3-methylbut-2-enyl diphosphate reductase IspH
MDNLYDINFQSNSEFYEIYIRYNVIHNWSTMNHLKNLVRIKIFLSLLYKLPKNWHNEYF